MYKCDICGREVFKKIKANGKILCPKHYHQYLNYGKFLDNIPRSTKDMNDYEIYEKEGYVKFYTYNQKNVRNGSFIIDIEDLDVVKKYKWRLSYGRVVTGNSTKARPLVYLTHLVLSVPQTDYHHKIDHIDGDPCNNRKNNLRICTQGENVLNKTKVSNNTSGFIGVHPDNRPNRKSHWCAEIRRENKKYAIGAYVELAEAVYARYIAELILFGEFRNTNQDKEKFDLFTTIPNKRKQQIEDYVKNKIIL